jgi:hypothetical protein
MTFLVGPALNKAIQKITEEDDVRCAVAFWGKGAETLFRDLKLQKVQIVCNLSSGGTNPFVIEEIKTAGAVVRQLDVLHAKVYIGRDQAKRFRQRSWVRRD